MLVVSFIVIYMRLILTSIIITSTYRCISLTMLCQYDVHECFQHATLVCVMATAIVVVRVRLSMCICI